jgi:addiction module HigA family antidote
MGGCELTYSFTGARARHRRRLGQRACRRLKVPTNRVTSILNGQRAISGDTALCLAHFFGTTPQFWLNLQGLYEIREGYPIRC